MKQLWTSKAVQVATRYGEHAPTAAVCCNACRTCVTTNLLGIAAAAAGAVGYGIANGLRRIRCPAVAQPAEASLAMPPERPAGSARRPFR